MVQSGLFSLLPPACGFQSVFPPVDPPVFPLMINKPRLSFLNHLLFPPLILHLKAYYYCPASSSLFRHPPGRGSQATSPFKVLLFPLHILNCCLLPYSPPPELFSCCLGFCHSVSSDYNFSQASTATFTEVTVGGVMLFSVIFFLKFCFHIST